MSLVHTSVSELVWVFLGRNGDSVGHLKISSRMIQASLDMLFLSLLCQGASHSLRSLFPGLQAESISRGDSPAEKETKSERTKSTEKDSFQGLGDSEGTICHVVTYSQALRSLSSKPYWAGSKGWTKRFGDASPHD